MTRTGKQPFEAATRLLLAPGTAQIYYGDELARPLRVAGAEGDANLRSFMNWGDLERRSALLQHWRKLGRFRRDHPAVGAGVHRTLQVKPFIFSRTLETGGGSIGCWWRWIREPGAKTIPVFGVFRDGTRLVDAYSGVSGTVKEGKVSLSTGSGLVLLGERR